MKWKVRKGKRERKTGKGGNRCSHWFGAFFDVSSCIVTSQHESSQCGRARRGRAQHRHARQGLACRGPADLNVNGLLTYR